MNGKIPAILALISITGGCLWLTSLRHSVFPWVSPVETFAMGRSGPPLPDDSLPETLTPNYNRSAQGSAIFPVGVMISANSKKAAMTSGTVVTAYTWMPEFITAIHRASHGPFSTSTFPEKGCIS
jgi:hypothetical protein